MKRGNLTILVADDSNEDRCLLDRAFSKYAKPAVSLQMTSSGNEAVAYLRGIEPFEDRNQFPYPTFLLTDLKMPDGDGFTILEHLKNTPQSTVIPTVVLSSSSDPDDIKQAYSLGASAYLIKPTDVLALTKMIQTLLTFWLYCEVPEVDQAGVQLNTKNTGKLGERFEHTAKL
ncbi:MAG: response regulator [Gammaproteobacteria bacterium]|jgi:CheY-like chemotaxis protein